MSEEKSKNDGDAPKTEEEEWTSVTKAETKRRLAPQHTLSKADLGADSPRAKATSVETIKKKGANIDSRVERD